MFSTEDTIVAIATPPGRGGLGVVRISGPSAQSVATSLLERAKPLRPRHATLTRVRGVDDVVATLFASPQSFTGDDVVEISAHGSPVVLQAIVDAALREGARLAEPGEFTLRAFLHGRLDLVQAEAVADLIDAVTPLQARSAFDQLEGTLTRAISTIDAVLFDLIARLEASLDFPEEGYHFIEPGAVADAIREVRLRVEALGAESRRGRLMREGAQVVIVGKPNVGKSSIFNSLAGASRVIVADQAGTTRDLVTERVDVAGIPVTLVDTAGIRESMDLVEREGVDRAKGAAAVAALLLVVFDRSAPWTVEDQAILEQTFGRPRLIVLNKCDQRREAPDPAVEETVVVEVSARSGSGMEELRVAMLSALGARPDLRDTPAVSNLRHASLLETALSSLVRAEAAASAGPATPEEFILIDLQQARAVLEEITGRRTSDDLLRHIFERFCIGK